MSYVAKTMLAAQGRSSEQAASLFISLVEDGFCFTEVSSSGTLLSFGQAEGPHPNSLTEAESAIRSFFAENNVKRIGWRNVELIVNSDTNVWIPNDVYSPAASKACFNLVGASMRNVFTAVSPKLASTACFEVDDTLVTAFKIVLQGLKVISQHMKLTAFASRSANNPVVILYWRKGVADFACFNDGRYLFGNSFRFQDDGDVFYKTLDLTRSYGLDTGTQELLIFGDVDRARYNRFAAVFPKVSLYSGNCSIPTELRMLQAYRHALLLTTES